MSDDNRRAQHAFLKQKDDIIRDVLYEEDLYKILGAPRSASAAELRRCYLERSKICHPDKPPFHPESTSAFQRLGFAFDILKSPRARRTYNRASNPTSCSLPDKTTFLGGDHTFRSAVEAILHEFITGDFVIVRRWLESLHAQYPNLVSEEVVINIERSFIRIRELVLTTRTYALLIYIELGRIHRVQKRLMGLRYLDVVGRARLTIHLVRVTLAVPMRVDRALKQREEKAWRAKVAGLQARGIAPTETMGQAGILNERVSKVLEFIVGAAGKDEGVDEEWSNSMGKTT
ncbi:putative DnaJ like protein subfamily B member 11 [Amylocarpus encephaloides]|uniref:DnaJ like protein subfamily B member 11 n=1 Tax=Amylocarpus encephaloides TaxID=45428 RepID=A0A9P8C6I4_9HELO|nr:putative DnaJ like protein subfamily B member 11 [Amylocarpus encephaloides]